jgi:hypothetical protein
MTRITQKEFFGTINEAIKAFEGEASELESAIGMLIVGQYVGWKVVLLWHSRATVRKYDVFWMSILGSGCQKKANLQIKRLHTKC